jgi:hypothetical protein
MFQRIREVWNGKRSLAETYWIWCIAVGIVFRIVSHLEDAFGWARGAPAAVIAFGLFSLIYVVFSLVGLWRSATNHPGAWSFLVKILVVIGALFSISTIVKAFMTPHA